MNQSAFKSFAVKEKKEVGTTARFLSGKMLIFAKLSLMSFIYDILETFCFPDEKVKKIYEKYQMEDVYIYHILTDRDSTSRKFVFISNAASEIPNTKYREIIFEVICIRNIGKRFDTSHSFWSQFFGLKFIKNLEHFEKPEVEYKEVARPTVDQGEMQKKNSLWCKFSQFNDKIKNSRVTPCKNL